MQIVLELHPGSRAGREDGWHKRGGTVYDLKSVAKSAKERH